MPIAEHQAIQFKLADMATKLEAARLLTRNAAERKAAGLRCDVEAGMAKLFASETALELATESMRIHGGMGYTTELPVERYYRDAPLMIIGEGTNEIQRLVIARGLLARAEADLTQDPVADRRGSGDAGAGAEGLLHDLAGGVERELVDELDRPGHLVVGHLRRGTTPMISSADGGVARARRRRRPCPPRRGARRGCR